MRKHPNRHFPLLWLWLPGLEGPFSASCASDSLLPISRHQSPSRVSVHWKAVIESDSRNAFPFIGQVLQFCECHPSIQTCTMYLRLNCDSMCHIEYECGPQGRFRISFSTLCCWLGANHAILNLQEDLCSGDDNLAIGKVLGKHVEEGAAGFRVFDRF